jgi:hypothetical protein
MGKRLVTHVAVGGVVYGPEDDVPADVAELITNPKAWGEDPPANGDDEKPAAKPAAKKTAAKKSAAK